jgi:hypothetical protein
MTPVGPQSLLRGLGEAGATHDQPSRHPLTAGAGRVLAFGDLRVAAGRCSRWCATRSRRCRRSQSAIPLVPQRTAIV